MPGFAPFRGLRYAPERLEPPLPPSRLDAVTAPPYDVIDDEDRAALAAGHPANAVHLILPRGADSYARAATDLATWRERGWLCPDDLPAFTVVRMRFADSGCPRETLGVLGALALPEVLHAEHDGPADPSCLLPHERTLPKAKTDRLALLRATRANLDPIWGLSPAPGLSGLLALSGPPDAEAVDADGTEHAVWRVDDPERSAAISAAVGGVALVIADGHHRCETALVYRDERRAAGITAAGDNAILTLVVELADEQLCIRPIHRLLTGLDGPPRAALAGAFELTELGPNTPDGLERLRARMASGEGFGLVDDMGLALLCPRPRLAAASDWPEAVRDVDAAVFAALVPPCLPAASVAYRHDDAYCAALVDKGAVDAVVLLRAPSVAQTRAAAAAGARMPEKTTFFFPKPRTGLVYRLLDS